MSSYWFEIAINFIETFVIFSFITLYLEPKYKKLKGSVCFFVAWMVGFIEICIMNKITFFESIGSYIPIAIYFIYAMLCLIGNILLKLWMSVITQIIVTMVAVVSNLGICYIIGYSPNDMILIFNSTRVAGVIISKIILVVTYMIVLKGASKNQIKTKLWYALIVIPLISVISITGIMKIALKYEDTAGYVLLGMVCIVIANILTYYFYTVISREYENKLRIELLEQQYENAKASIDNSTLFVEQMHAVRHDIKNQLLTLAGYIESEKKTEALQYIEHLTNDCLPNIQKVIETGDTAVDAILNMKATICLRQKIFLQIKFEDNCISGIEQTDTVILFGNLLDNAIEAAEKSAKKRVCLDVRNKGEYLSVCITNSIDESVLDKNRELKTTKENKKLHGLGLKSVKAVVDKYNGMIQLFEENGEFCCHLLLLKS